MFEFKYFPALSLFDEGAGQGVNGGAAVSENGVKFGNAKLQNVVYGKQDAEVFGAQGTNVKASETDVDRSAAETEKAAAEQRAEAAESEIAELKRQAEASASKIAELMAELAALKAAK